MVFEYLANLLGINKSAKIEGTVREEAHKIYESAITSLENMFSNPIIGLDTRQDVEQLGKIVKSYETKHPLCRIDGKVFYLTKDNNNLLAPL
ncbi:MAG: hypothetical protein WA139_03720 [Candidatus Aenigmatarchaeota archaeon]